MDEPLRILIPPKNIGLMDYQTWPDILLVKTRKQTGIKTLNLFMKTKGCIITHCQCIFDSPSTS